jgi:hypothetical protein
VPGVKAAPAFMATRSVAARAATKRFDDSLLLLDCFAASGDDEVARSDQN